MTGICIVGEWTERACFAGLTGATAASLLRQPEPQGIELGLRLSATDGWRIGVTPPVVAAAVAFDRFEEEPERWDGMS